MKNKKDVDKAAKRKRLRKLYMFSMRRVQPTCLEDRLDILVKLGGEKLGRVLQKAKG